MKTSLPTHFARMLDDELDAEEVGNWFATLGMMAGKTDITENAAALAEYFGDLGFNTGEDYPASPVRTAPSNSLPGS